MKKNFLKILGLTATLALAGIASATTGSGPLTDADVAAKAKYVNQIEILREMFTHSIK